MSTLVAFCASAGRPEAGTRARATRIGARILRDFTLNLLMSISTSTGRKWTDSPPRHQPFDPADACQIVVDHRNHQHHQHDEACKQHLFLYAHTEVAPERT